MTLAETQARMHEAITFGGDVLPNGVADCVADSPTLAATECVEIYANMYLWRLVDALRETFPKLALYLGDETFASLAEDHVRRHPSEHHDVGQVGRLLPAFLREHPDFEQPWLADLAALEWARHEVFFAPEAMSVGPDVLSEVGAEELGTTGFTLHPSLRVLILDHAVLPLWRALENGEPAAPPTAGIAPVAVWRSGYQVHHCALALDEAVALEGAMRAEPLPRVCAAFAGGEDPSATASRAIASWFHEGWVVGLRHGANGSPSPPVARHGSWDPYS